MFRHRCLVVFGILWALTAVVSGQDGCPYGLAPRLAAGELGRVTPGPANNLRAEPARRAEKLGQIAAGQVFRVVDGPACVDDFTWWQVEYGVADGWVTGWTVESGASDYFLEPLAGEVVRFGEVSLILPPDVAEYSEGIFAEAVTGDVKAYNNMPAYVEFTFEGYPDEDYPEFDYPSVRVYEVDAFDGIENMLGDAGQSTMEELPRVLEEWPDLYSFGVIYNRIPDETPGAANALLTQMRYLSFRSGSGYRFVTFYAQNFVGTTNHLLMYRYLGLTDDGKYFISARFPIDSPNLPAPFDDQSDGFGVFESYAHESAELFDAIAPQDYTPDLNLLDALIASLEVGEK